MAEVLEFSEMFYTNFDPQMKNHFIMEIDGIPSYLIKSTGLPEVQFNIVTLDHINLKRKIKGKASWNDLTVTMYNPITPSGQQAVMEWVRLSHEALTGRDGYPSMYKKDIDIFLIGPAGTKTSQWKLKGAWISTFGGGDMSWADDEAQELNVVISYDLAILEY